MVRIGVLYALNDAGYALKGDVYVVLYDDVCSYADGTMNIEYHQYTPVSASGFRRAT